MSARLLDSWALARRSSGAWRAVLHGSDDATDRLRVVATAIAIPRSPEGIVEELLRAGEFETADLLLMDDRFLTDLESGQADQLERLVEQARRAHIERLRLSLAELAFRGSRVEERVEVDQVLQSAGSLADDDRTALVRIEAQVRGAEQKVVSGLLAELEESEVGAQDGGEVWAASVRSALTAGAIDVAKAMLAAGPSADLPEAFAVPPPPVWPYRTDPLVRVVGWFHHEGAIPPGFGRYAPPTDDAAATAFLQALRQVGSEVHESLPRSLAAMLSSKVLRVDESGGGLTAYLDDLSAPGLHAFARQAWPSGVPVWVADDPDSPDPEVEEGALVVRLVLGKVSRRSRRVLHLHVHDVLAVLHDSRRRARLLAVLARQLPPERAFETAAADASVRWLRRDVPDLLAPSLDGRPTLLVAAPGMGKTTLLQELAAGNGVALVDARTAQELPEESAILVDGIERLDTAALTRIASEIHRVTTSRTPAPVVIVAARPEVRLTLGCLGVSFDVLALPPRSLDSLREQATTMLGWVGIASDDPGAYAKLAMLAGGNPTVLFYLCQALADLLADEGHKRFGRQHVDAAWASPPLRRSLRALLWDPICEFDGVEAVVQAIVQYSSPEAPLSREDLKWATGVEDCGRAPGWLEDRYRLLAEYGLVSVTDTGIGLAIGGPALLVPEWLNQ
jgi:hypothetical protein